MAALPDTPPTRELGAPQQGLARNPGPFGIAGLIEEREYQRDWIWPVSIRETVPRMLNDAHLDGLYRGATLPIRSYEWRIDPNGAPDDAVSALQADVGLDLVGQDPQPRRRQQRRFSFDEHLETALKGIVYGHRMFEQLAEIRDDRDGGGMFAHLRKLADRPPYTIEDIVPAPDGALDHIKVPSQNLNAAGRLGVPGTVDITVDRLVAYVWDREGADWRGRSMLRSCHRPWKIKDRILAVGAINIERAGGVPYVEAPPDATAQQMAELHQLAASFRVGESAGAAVPYRAQLKFASAAGGDQAVGYVRLQNEEMARAWLMMFMQLGQTETGSRALGASFIDYFAEAQKAIAAWFCGVFNKHVIEDWFGWNYGPDVEYAPRLVFEPAGDPVAAMGAAVEDAQSAGALPADSQAAALLGGQRDRRFPVAAAQTVNGVRVPDRTLRRQPTGVEAAAGTDFAQLEQAYLEALVALTAVIAEHRTGQIAQAAERVRDAGDDLEKLTAVTVDAAGADEVAQVLRQTVEAGATEALNEAAGQGVDTAADAVDLEELAARIDDRARALTALIAEDVALAARQTATRLVDTPGLPGTLADQVELTLTDLKWQRHTDLAKGEAQAASNGGRFAAMNAVTAQATGRVYHSALLDANTCGPCLAQDGHEYVDVQDAEAAFASSGGYVFCEGNYRCRCTPVLVMDETPATVQ